MRDMMNADVLVQMIVRTAMQDYIGLNKALKTKKRYATVNHQYYGTRERMIREVNALEVFFLENGWKDLLDYLKGETDEKRPAADMRHVAKKSQRKPFLNGGSTSPENCGWDGPTARYMPQYGQW